MSSSAHEVNSIVNEQDEIIGYKAREQITQADIYRAASLWVTNPLGDILLAQRAFTKSHHPGIWGPAAAGTVEKGETYEQNIIKEAAEELGLKDIHPVKGPKYRARGEHNHFTQVFTLVVDQPAEAFTIEESEVAQVRWFTREELQRELRDQPQKFVPRLAWVFENI